MAITEQTARQSSPSTSLVPATSKLITAATCPPAVAAAYLTLRTNLDFALLGRPNTVLMAAPITSSVPSAHVVANMALALAGSGDEILAVDCNLHEPSLHTAFGLSNEWGLRHLLTGGWAERELQIQTSGLPNLRVLTAGPGWTGALSQGATNEMSETILRLKTMADRLILLGPPLLSYTDALTLSPCVDGLVVIVSAHGTRRADLSRAREMIARANAPLVGAILLDGQPPE